MPELHQTDERLARRSAEGDRAALAALYIRHRSALVGYCQSITRHREDACDAVQDAIVKAWLALPHQPDDLAVRPWLFRIAHNEAVSIVRRRAAEVPVADGDRGAIAGADQATLDRERVGEMLFDLRLLPARQRSALLLRVGSGLEYQELADVLGVSEEAARQRVSAARRGLREQALGRNLLCADVQRSLAAGDRRMLRRRALRSHLRSCGTCAEIAAGLRSRSPLAVWPVWLWTGVKGGVLGMLCRVHAGPLGALAGDPSATPPLRAVLRMKAAVVATIVTGVSATTAVHGGGLPRADPPASVPAAAPLVAAGIAATPVAAPASASPPDAAAARQRIRATPARRGHARSDARRRWRLRRLAPAPAPAGQDGAITTPVPDDVLLDADRTAPAADPDADPGAGADPGIDAGADAGGLAADGGPSADASGADVAAMAGGAGADPDPSPAVGEPDAPPPDPRVGDADGAPPDPDAAADSPSQSGGGGVVAGEDPATGEDAGG